MLVGRSTFNIQPENAVGLKHDTSQSGASMKFSLLRLPGYHTVVDILKLSLPYGILGAPSKVWECLT